MLPSWLQEALECPHKTHLNSRSSPLLRQMQSLWGRICNGEFKNGIEPSVLGLQYDRWGNREEEEMPGEGLRWLAVWNTSPKQLRSRDCIHFIYFFSLKTMLFRPTSCPFFSHIPQALKWDVSLTLEPMLSIATTPLPLIEQGTGAGDPRRAAGLNSSPCT